MRAVRRLGAPILILILLLTRWGSARAQSVEVQYFPETGHNVRDDFLRYYNSVPNPELLFGYPITEQIVSRDGKTVQYFQRARFELGTDFLGKPRVDLSAVGKASYSPGGQLNINDSPGCELFRSGFRVCFAFLDFYKANGGAAQFGDPVSPFEYHDNLIVQYFENARFEWRADRPEGQRVAISDLGRVYFDRVGEDPAHLRPAGPLDATIDPVLSIKARAFVSKSITASSGEQTVFVILQSQTYQPIPNAPVRAAVHWPDGRTEEYSFTTNGSGVGSVSFVFGNQKQGELVTIEITATYQGLTSRTTTSFRLWY